MVNQPDFIKKDKQENNTAKNYTKFRLKLKDCLCGHYNTVNNYWHFNKIKHNRTIIHIIYTGLVNKCILYTQVTSLDPYRLSV